MCGAGRVNPTWRVGGGRELIKEANKQPRRRQ
jgi:hypothetical protein